MRIQFGQMSWKTSKLNKQPDEDGVGSIFKWLPWHRHGRMAWRIFLQPSPAICQLHRLQWRVYMEDFRPSSIFCHPSSTTLIVGRLSPCKSYDYLKQCSPLTCIASLSSLMCSSAPTLLNLSSFLPILWMPRDLVWIYWNQPLYCMLQITCSHLWSL